jgi:hypothetical protein
MRLLEQCGVGQVASNCCGRASAAAVRSSYELPGLDPKRRCQPFQIVDRKVSQPTFDAADVRAIDAAEIRERFLSEFPLRPYSPQIGREDLPESAWIGSFHPRIELGCQLEDDGL